MGDPMSPRFRLSEKSLFELDRVQLGLVRVVKRAIEITTQDFAVHDGLRTFQEQKALVAAGASQTMESRHLAGQAVDLVPVINGKLRWEWEPIYAIAEAMRKAARELQIPLRWGGAWDVAFTDSTDSPEHLVAVYVDARRSKGLRAFTDGPHFELSHPSQQYPGVDPEGLGSAWQGVSP